jgi:SNF2 family DNA or RNA helicase
MAEKWAKEFIYPAWKHQGLEFRKYKDKRARALHWQMRTGKTKAMIDLACYLHEKGEIDTVVILAPNNVHNNWIRREIPSHNWLGVPYSALAWNSSQSRKAHFEEEFLKLMDRKGLAWYAVNVEATSIKGQQQMLKALLKKRKRFMLIVDEVHEWRRPGSKRSKFVRNTLAPKAAYVRILSGTMVDNNPMHAYAQYEILGKAALGFSTFRAFEQHFGVWTTQQIYTPRGARTIPVLESYRNMDELREKMRTMTSYVYRDECDDLPELIVKPVEFEMDSQQKRIYNELVRGALVKLDTGEHLDVDTEGLITKLQTIRSGYVKDAEGEVHWLVEDEDNPAFNALLDLVRRTEGKLIVWCRFRLEIETLEKLLKKAGFLSVTYYGGTRPMDRLKHEERFRHDPTCKVMIAQPKACGQGLDFSAGEHIVWFSHVHGDLIGRRQADERCTKMGGRKIAVTDMVGLGTVDTRILEDQDKKVTQTDYLTGEGLRELLRIVP